MTRMKFCDLHMHSTASDGQDAPETLARLAKKAGLSAIALTDHDTTAGLAAAAAAARRARIRFVPGIELSADPQLGSPHADARRGTLHILGMFIRHDAPSLKAIEARLLEARRQRNPQIVANLNALGVKITYDEVVALAPGVVGRPHIAQVMVNKGYVKSIHEAFAKYIGEGKPAYARKDRLTAAQAIDAIHDAGGLAMLAHPVQLKLDADELEHAVATLVKHGLDGIETQHSDHTAAMVEQYRALARQYDLLECGGSDYHGPRKPVELGSQRVAFDVYEALQAAWKAQAAATARR
jgi:predicted metal-dependent phosphoesterase TrpH